MELAQEQEISQGLLAILSELKKKRSMDGELWCADEIADFLKLSKQGVQSHILGKDGFPEPIILPSNGRRWVAKEVRAWAMKRR